MPGHNVAIHISWLLSNEVTPPVGVSATASTQSSTAAGIVHANVLEEDIEQVVPTAASSPISNRRITEAINLEFENPQTRHRRQWVNFPLHKGLQGQVL